MITPATLSSNQKKPARNWRTVFRRFIGLVVGFCPVSLLIASLVQAIVYGGVAFPRAGFIPLAFALFGLFVAGVNVYWVWLDPWRYRQKQGTMEGYRFISGIPLFGTLCVVIAGVLGFGGLATTVIGLLTLVLDTGGLPWFIICVWDDESLWMSEKELGLS